MGTHATTKVKDGSSVVVNMYRHYDGYVDGHGKELAEFLSDISLTNGLGADKTNVANGMGDLAAQIVAHFKQESGGFYLVAIDTDEEFDYLVYEKKGEIQLQVKQDGKTVFVGTPKEFLVQEALV